MRTLEARPHSLSPRGLAITGWIALAVALAAFAALAWNLGPGTPLVRLDEAISGWMQARHAGPVTAFMLFVTQMHSLGAIAVWSAILAAILWRRGERYWVGTLAAAVAGGMALNWILKLAYERARPHFDAPLLTLGTYSFPSGHTAASTVFYGVLVAFLVSRFHEPRLRIACIAGGIAAVALVALSRVYLGAHYASDVIAAACSSTVWLVLCLGTGHAVVRRRMGAP